ncbi:MAG: HIT domain-containing protein [Nanoarchaeota archaeon]
MAAQPSIEEIKQQCIFCQIISGAVASKKVFEDDKVIAVLDINPGNPGHMLVIPKEHYSIMPQIPDSELEHFGMVAKGLSRSAISGLKAQGTTVFIANGVAAGQRAQHFMMHVIPRLEEDGIGIILPEKQVKGEDFEKIHAALVPVITKVLGFTSSAKKESIEEKPKEEEKNEVEEPEVKETLSEVKKTRKSSKKKSEEVEAGENSLDDIAKLLTGK